MTTILGEEALAAFRAYWNGPRLLDLITEHGGGVLILWPIGVGKSCAIDRIIEAAVGSGRYDLVIALAPTRRVLEERAWIRTPPSGLKIVNLRPRPRQRCGDLDGPWRHFEQAGMAALGRVELCGRCPRRPGCYWPRQYGKGLEGAQVIFGTDAHIARSPDFGSQLAGWAGAARVLTLVDEINFLATGFRRRVARADLVRFARVLGEVDSGRWGAFHGDWCWRTELLLRAPSADLRHPDWRMPTFPIDWAVEVQARGWEAHDTRFRFLGHDLQQFGRSPLESRERHANGDLSFAAPPAVRGDVAIFSGTALPEFLRFRLGRDLACPFAGYRFGHPGTRWFNIASRLGMRAHFPGNADQILDFFASLVSRRLSEGRRPLLIAKKWFVGLCAAGLRRRLGEYHPSPVEIVTGDWDTIDLMRPDVIPLINFGLIGTNLFEHFDCAYCLTGFYVNRGDRRYDPPGCPRLGWTPADRHHHRGKSEASSRSRRGPAPAHLRRGPTGPTRSRPARDGRCAPGRRPRPAVHAAARDHAFPVRRPPAAGLRPRVRLDRGGPRILRTPHAPRTGAGPERRPSPGRTTGGDDAASGGGSAPAGAIDHSTVLEPSRRPHEPF